MLLRLPAVRATLLLAMTGLGALAATARCAKTQCAINSDCGFRRYCDIDQVCRSECAEDRDCAEGFCDLNGRCQSGARDAGADDVSDAGAAPDVPAAVDAPPPVDNPPPADVVIPPVDNPPTDIVSPPVDNPPPADVVAPPADLGPARGAYLDPCATSADCASNDCAVTNAGARFCTRACAQRAECGAGYLCMIPAGAGVGRCVLDDTGAPCRLASNNCAGYCYTTVGSNVAHCTHECSTASDCPAGFACQPTGTNPPGVCAEVERPCNRGSDCATSVCLGGLSGTAFRGCSSDCRTAADCPRRALLDNGGSVLPLPQYTCMNVEGHSVCVPPLDVLGGDIVGSDPMGASCNASPGAINQCRSGLCEATAGGGVCIQGCTLAGGCPVNFGCFPDQDPGTLAISLVCRPAGTVPVGGACTAGSQCVTAICQMASPTSGYCTRFANDRICPTGMRPMPFGSAVDGTPISLCVR